MKTKSLSGTNLPKYVAFHLQLHLHCGGITACSLALLKIFDAVTHSSSKTHLKVFPNNAEEPGMLVISSLDVPTVKSDDYVATDLSGGG